MVSINWRKVWKEFDEASHILYTVEKFEYDYVKRRLASIVHKHVAITKVKARKRK